MNMFLDFFSKTTIIKEKTTKKKSKKKMKENCWNEIFHSSSELLFLCEMLPIILWKKMKARDISYDLPFRVTLFISFHFIQALTILYQFLKDLSLNDFLIPYLSLILYLDRLLREYWKEREAHSLSDFWELFLWNQHVIER